MINLSQELKDTYFECARTQDRIEVNIIISAQWTYFLGHFPSSPVLPAVAILDISQYFVEKLLRSSAGHTLSEVVSFRIKNPVTPLEKINIKVERESDNFHILWKSSETADKLFAEINLKFSQQ